MSRPRSNLLIDDHPIQILPRLAQAIGLNEAIFAQQLHWWLRPENKTAHVIDGRRWVYNTYEGWREDNFPFWSVATIKRTVYSLERSGLVVTENFNKHPIDKTKWYTLDYDILAQIEGELETSETTSYQNDTSIVSKCDVDRIKMIRPIPVDHSVDHLSLSEESDCASAPSEDEAEPSRSSEGGRGGNGGGEPEEFLPAMKSARAPQDPEGLQQKINILLNAKAPVDFAERIALLYDVRDCEALAAQAIGHSRARKSGQNVPPASVIFQKAARKDWAINYEYLEEAEDPEEDRDRLYWERREKERAETLDEVDEAVVDSAREKLPWKKGKK